MRSSSSTELNIQWRCRSWRLFLTNGRSLTHIYNLMFNTLITLELELGYRLYTTMLHPSNRYHWPTSRPPFSCRRIPRHLLTFKTKTVLIPFIFAFVLYIMYVCTHTKLYRKCVLHATQKERIFFCC